MNILVGVAILLLTASVGWFYVLYNRKVVFLEGRIIELARSLADANRKIEELRAELTTLEDQLNDDHVAEELGKVLEKKWEDAINVISNFDPFATEEDK